MSQAQCHQYRRVVGRRSTPLGRGRRNVIRVKEHRAVPGQRYSWAGREGAERANLAYTLIVNGFLVRLTNQNPPSGRD
jgi:hypothetical protein